MGWGARQCVQERGTPATIDDHRPRAKERAALRAGALPCRNPARGRGERNKNKDIPSRETARDTATRDNTRLSSTAKLQ